MALNSVSPFGAVFDAGPVMMRNVTMSFSMRKPCGWPMRVILAHWESPWCLPKCRTNWQFVLHAAAKYEGVSRQIPESRYFGGHRLSFFQSIPLELERVAVLTNDAHSLVGNATRSFHFNFQCDVDLMPCDPISVWHASGFPLFCFGRSWARFSVV